MRLLTKLVSLFKNKSKTVERTSTKTFVLLVGPPGSGKSTFANNFYEPHSIVNQDKLGSRKACVRRVRRILATHDLVVIDRCNINKEQRKVWIDLAKEYGARVECVVFLTPPALCAERAFARSGHPTIHDLTFPEVSDIVYKFRKSFHFPEKKEGLDEVVTKYAL